MLHPFPQASDGIIASFPIFDFDFASIGETVVASAVMGGAVAHRFDEDGFAAIFECHSAGFFGDFTHGENVIAVDADGVNAVANAAAGDAVAAVLLDCCGGDGEAVVSTDEYYGTRACGCYV